VSETRSRTRKFRETEARDLTVLPGDTVGLPVKFQRLFENRN
jgi:hypothetical protein